METSVENRRGVRVQPAGSRPRVLLFEDIHPEALAWLRGQADVILARELREDALLPLVGEIDGIVVRANGRITERMLAHAPRLRVVARHGVGLDNVDVEACTRRGVWVVYTPLANAESVAEHAVGLMLALAKCIVIGDRAIRAGEFDSGRRVTGQELSGKTLGIVGFGRIGQRVAGICRTGLAMPIVFSDVLAHAEAAARVQAERLPLDQLLGRSDVISLHLPLTPESRHLINEATLARMKPGVILINTSRGGVIDEPALIRRLQEGRLSAGLDVYEEEPLPQDSLLPRLSNVALTPHAAAHTEQALRAMAMVVEDVVHVLKGEIPRFPANSPAKAVPS